MLSCLQLTKREREREREREKEREREREHAGEITNRFISTIIQYRREKWHQQDHKKIKET